MQCDKNTGRAVRVVDADEIIQIEIDELQVLWPGGTSYPHRQTDNIYRKQQCWKDSCTISPELPVFREQQ